MKKAQLFFLLSVFFLSFSSCASFRDVYVDPGFSTEQVNNYGIICVARSEIEYKFSEHTTISGAEDILKAAISYIDDNDRNVSYKMAPVVNLGWVGQYLFPKDIEADSTLRDAFANFLYTTRQSYVPQVPTPVSTPATCRVSV